MKKIACSQVGGSDCDFVITAETEEEALRQWHKHFPEAHPKVVANVTNEEKAKWKESHHQIWEDAPEI